jgi:hypothetical protein
VSCWVDDIQSRSLTGPVVFAGDMTVAKCAAHCQAFEYFGVEYAVECYCGDALSGTAAGTESECSQLCAGDNTEWCGGPNRLSLYRKADNEPPTPTSTSTPTSTDPPTTSTDPPTTSETSTSTDPPTTSTDPPTTSEASTSTDSPTTSTDPPTMSETSTSTDPPTSSETPTSTEDPTPTATPTDPPPAVCNPDHVADPTAPRRITMANDGDMAYWRYPRNAGLGRPTFSYVAGNTNPLAWRASFASSSSPQSLNPGRDFSAVRGATYSITLRYRISTQVTDMFLNVVDHADGSTPNTATADPTAAGTWETLTVQYTPRTDSLVVILYVSTLATAGALDVTFDGVEITMITPSPWSSPITLESGAITLVDWRSGSATTWPHSLYYTNAAELASMNVPSGSITWSYDSPGYDGPSFARRVSFNGVTPPVTGADFFYSVRGFMSDPAPVGQFILKFKLKSINSASCSISTNNHLRLRTFLSGCEDDWQTFESDPFTPISGYMLQILLRCSAPGASAKAWFDNIYMIPNVLSEEE